MSLIIDCPIPGCDSLPWTDPGSLAEHLAEHDTPATSPAPTPPAPPAPASDTVRSFSPGGTRAARVSGRPVNEPDRPLPFCRWTRNGSDWVIRGPIASLRAGTTVTVEKASGERKQVDIDPASITPDARNRYDRCDMGLARPAPKATAATEAAGPVPVGFHVVDDVVFKVQAAKSTGNLYAKRLVPSPTGKKGKFEYAPGAIRELSAATFVADAEAAAAFGRKFGFCIRCGALLTDPNSVERGIGPVCATKF